MKQTAEADKRRFDPAEWIDAYGDMLFRYALVRLRDQGLAEDVVQETFLSALASRQNFAGRSTERTWLVGILKHKIVDILRKRSRERPVDDFEALQDMGKEDFDETGRWRVKPASWTTDSSTLYQQKEFWEVLEACLSDLPERLAAAFSLRELEEMETKELCKVLHISPTNLWVMLHRARHRLRGCLEENWFDRT